MIEILHSKLSKGQEQYILSGNYRGKHLGSGATARVSTYGPNRVIRVQERKSSYDPADVIPWVKFCLKSRSRHVPKIDFFAVEYTDRGRVDRIFTVLEKLEESYTVRGICEEDAYAVEALIYDPDDEDAMLDYSLEARKRFPIPAVKRLAKSVNKHNLYFNDLHDGNWMVRKRDGRMVITDPIC